MANPQNLTVPKPGEVRNPNGRGKGTPNKSTLARMVLEMESTIPEKVFSKIKAMYPGLKREGTIEFIALLQQATKAIVNQDTQAVKFLMDTAYGKDVQSVDLNADDDDEVVPFTEQEMAVLMQLNEMRGADNAE